MAGPVGRLDGASDHQLHHLLERDVGDRALVHRAAVLQHQDAVALREHLVEVVRDEQDAEALPLEVDEEGEQALRLGQRQRGRRLVQDQDARAGGESLEDVEDLQLAQAQRVALAREVDADAEAVGELLGVLHQRAVVDQTAPQRLASQHDVLRAIQRPDDRDLLMRHRDAGRQGVADAAEPHQPADDPKRAGVRQHGPADDLHQRRLAGTVGADEGQHLAGTQLQVDLGQRRGRPEALADRAGLQQRVVGHGVRRAADGSALPPAVPLRPSCRRGRGRGRCSTGRSPRRSACRPAAR